MSRLKAKMTFKNSIFNELREQQHFCDILVRVSHLEFHAHKIMLCNCSPYFRALLTRWLKPDCHFVQVSEVSPHIMNLIIEYAYTDSMTVTEKNVQELFIAADRFSIMGIVQVCRELLEQLLSPQNCIGIMRFGDMYYQPDLKRKAFLFLMAHFEEVVSWSEEFKALSASELVDILKNDLINAREETIVFEAIVNWIQFAPKERHRFLGLLLTKVRLAQISEEYIKQCVFENQLVKTYNKSIPWNHLAPPRLPSAILLAMGGWTGSFLDTLVNSIESYDFRACQWSNVSHKNGTPRANHGSVFLNGFVYCVGGNDDAMELLNSVDRFDPEAHIWQEVAPMHYKRSHVCVTMLDGCIYAIGGFDGQNRLDTAEIFQPESNQWTEIPQMHEKRCDAGCVAFNGKVYVFGGSNGWMHLSIAECYDPQTKEWTMIANMEVGRSGLGVIAYANRIFAVGGHNGNLCVNSVDSYDPVDNSWHQEAPMLINRNNFGISVLDGRIFAVGGDSESGVISNVECYDAGTTQWLSMCPLSVRRSGLSCCVLHGLDNIADYALPRYSPPC